MDALVDSQEHEPGDFGKEGLDAVPALFLGIIVGEDVRVDRGLLRVAGEDERPEYAFGREADKQKSAPRRDKDDDDEKDGKAAPKTHRPAR